jgi:hypothetical protein
MSLRSCAVVAGFSVLAAGVAQAALTHRYSFDSSYTSGPDTFTPDSIGGQDAQLLDGANVVTNHPQAGSVLKMPGDTNFGAKASIPTAAMSGYTSFTVEGWFFFDRYDFYNGERRLFQLAGTNNSFEATMFGGAGSGGGFGDWWQHTRIDYPNGSGGWDKAYYQHNGLGNVADGNVYYFAASVDTVANTLTYGLMNGANPQFVTVAIPANVDFSFIGSTGIYVGGADWGSALLGGVSEFRIYDSPLTASQMQANALLGPNVIPEPATLGLVGLSGAAVLRRRRHA